MLIVEKDRICMESEGQTVGEITFPETEPGVFTIDHTYVDRSCRGAGLAAELVKAAVEEIRRRGGQVRATCSYAALWLARQDDAAGRGEA